MVLADLTLLTVAVILMLGGAVMLLVGVVGAGIAIPLIAVGIGVTAIVELDNAGPLRTLRLQPTVEIVESHRIHVNSTLGEGSR